MVGLPHMNDITNDFSQLDAQSAESRFAQFTTEEHAEFQAWLDMVYGDNNN
jgi:hypothetical protein